MKEPKLDYPDNDEEPGDEFDDDDNGEEYEGD